MNTTLVLAATLLLTVAQPAPPPSGTPAPVLLRIEGFVGPPPPRVTTVASWRVSVGNGVYDLRVTKLRSLSGPLAPFTVIKRLEPYPVAFALAGDQQAIEAFTTAPRGRPLAITGILELQHANRVLSVSKVEANAPPTPAAELDEHFGAPPPDGNFAVPPPAE